MTVLSPPDPPSTESPVSLSRTGPDRFVTPIAPPRRRPASTSVGTRPQRPREFGELLGESVRQQLVVVGHRDDRPAGLLGIEPTLHRERRHRQHPRVALHLVGAVEQLLHRPLGGEVLLLMGQHPQLSPPDRRRDLTGEQSSGEHGEVAGGLQLIVGLGAEADDDVGPVDHRLGHVGVVVEHDGDADRISDDAADGFEQRDPRRRRARPPTPLRATT